METININKETKKPRQKTLDPTKLEIFLFFAL